MADNKTSQNIFAVSDFRKLQLLGQIPEKTREFYREFGYFGGGSSSLGIFSTIYRLDYSNDTQSASVRGRLSTQRSENPAGTGNSNFGYFGGGQTGGGYTSRIDKINYSNDTSTASIVGSLLSSLVDLAAVGNKNFGYFVGGRNPAQSTVARLDYANDLTKTSKRGNLTLSRSNIAAAGNSNYGYISGYYISSVDRIDYSVDLNTSLQRGNLASNRDRISATGNQNFGYFAGATNPVRSTIERIDYNNDTATALVRSPMTISRRDPFSTGNSNYGYFTGGSETIAYSRTDRLDYSNDTTSVSIRGSLPLGISGGGATSSHNFGGTTNSYLGAPWVATSPYGYFGAGYNGSATAIVDRLDYSNDTAINSSKSPVNIPRFHVAAVGNSTYGYNAGGFNSSFTVTSFVDRLDYSNDNSAQSPRSNLIKSMAAFSAAGNTNFGYFGCGNNGPLSSSILRLNYSTDTITEVSSLLAPSQWHVANGNRNFAYYAGGFAPSLISTIQRFNYSTDTSRAQIRCFLSFPRVQSGTTGTEHYGYFGGGYVQTTLVDRIEYANDTANAIVRSPLNSAKSSINTATGNSSYGYIGGGSFGGGVYESKIERIDYSNDTQTVAIRGRLTVARSSLGVVSSQSYGGVPNTTIDPLPTKVRNNTTFNNTNILDLPYKRPVGSYAYFCGGDSTSLVQRIDYSNDLTTPSIRGRLSISQNTYASFGTKNYGYVIGNIFIGPNSTNHRIDYSNDLSTALNRNNNNGTWVFINGFGNSKYGYNIGGAGSGTPRSSVFRLDFSNDSSSMISRGNLRLPVCKSGTTETEQFGYYAGGSRADNENISNTNVGRINFSNDTTTSLIRGALAVSRLELAGSGNSNYGYFTGGGSTVIERVDYSNDLSSPLGRGKISFSRNGLSGAGNSNFGYFGGGYNASRVDRINYSNDTANASIRNSLTRNVYRVSAVTNARSS